MRFVGSVNERRIVRLALGDQHRTAAQRLDQFCQVDEHEMAVANPSTHRAVRRAVVARFLAHVEDGAGGQGGCRAGGAAHDVLVAGVGKLSPGEDADDRDREVGDMRIEPAPLVGPGLVLVVVDMGVAGMPALRRQIDPAFERQLHLQRAGARYLDRPQQGPILGAPLDNHVGRPTEEVEREGAVAIEERRPTADLEERIRWRPELSGALEDMDSGLQCGPGPGVVNVAAQRRHSRSPDR